MTDNEECGVPVVVGWWFHTVVPLWEVDVNDWLVPYASSVSLVEIWVKGDGVEEYPCWACRVDVETTGGEDVAEFQSPAVDVSSTTEKVEFKKNA